MLLEIDIQCCNIWDKIYYQFPYHKKGMLTAFQQRNFSLELPEILSQNHICYYWLSFSGNSKIMHCGILINMPYSLLITKVCAVSYKKNHSDYEFMISLARGVSLVIRCTILTVIDRNTESMLCWWCTNHFTEYLGFLFCAQSCCYIADLLPEI